MPRIARAIAVGFPHHIVQRGNNREKVFFNNEDREQYLSILTRPAAVYEIKRFVVLMDKHTRLCPHTAICTMDTWL